jgi:hypothetical protein
MTTPTLPKAALIQVEWSWRFFYFAKHRLANAMRVQIGWLTLTWRMPWIEYVARVNHPECFAHEREKDHSR